MSAPLLAVDGLGARVGTFALRDVSFAVAAGRTLAVLGPNGAGKTTLLDAIAGLRQIAAGTVRIDGDDCTRLAPERRRVGYVVQDYALFPHLTVRGNVRFGMPRGRHGTEEERALLERLRIAELAERRPSALSGGERQRVAVARALAAESRVVLFDEPTAAADVTLRAALRAELRGLPAAFGLASVIVTHDWAEAAAVADDVMILRDGRVVQQGPLDAVFDRPIDAFVARFAGYEDVRAARVVEARGGTSIVELAENGVRLAAADDRFPPGALVAACIRAVRRPDADDVRLAPPE